MAQHFLTTPDYVSNSSITQTRLLTERHPLVLVAENNEEHLSELKELLKLYSLAVVEARDGEAAFDLTVRACPDLILLNLRLPRIEGYEAARLIRCIKSFDATPIIFFSNETEDAFRRKALAVGGNSFHFAPLDLERLDWILEKFLYPINFS